MRRQQLRRVCRRRRMRQAGGGSKWRLIRRGRVGRLRNASGVARWDADAHHRGKLLHRRRRRPSVALVREVSRSRDTSGLVLVRWHGVVLLVAVWRIVGVHHVLGMLGVLLMLIMMRRLPVLVVGHVVLWLLPPRATAHIAHVSHVCHVSIHIHAAVDASGCSLYVLPSRQMAVTHPAGLGDRTVADIAQCCSGIYLHRQLSAGRGICRS